ncbi:hypothetical protein HK097_009794 [Rhizophlyctis rosea]|uniref:Uncharacterized protein n=1 Tax=Rhizophlyctis rosea TaxID=64517 RepID=A0AAD5SBJ3_9FUNG|nr:hypothetical protein HK097_009794 [Rhizophlyctis rosea]
MKTNDAESAPWKEWLEATFPSPVAAHETFYKYNISSRGKKLPYQSNAEAKAALENLWLENLDGGTTKDDRVAGLLIGCPGCGKTRCLSEMKTLLPDVSIVYVISYNNGNPPDKFDEAVGANGSMGLRLLHAAYSGDITFADFAKRIPENLHANDITFTRAISLLPSSRESDRVVIGFDEINVVVEWPSAAKAAYLKEFGTVLGSTCRLSNPPMILVAGTTGLDLERELKNSKMNYRHVPLPPLLFEQQAQILDDVISRSNPDIDWRRDRNFRRLLTQVGGLPRCFEYLVNAIGKWLAHEGVGIESWDCDRILTDVRYAATKYITIPENYAAQLVEDVILQTHVRPDFALPGHTVTYEILQKECNILLIPSLNFNLYKVFVPYMSLHMLLATPAAARDAVLVKVRNLLRHGEVSYWQSFEVYVAEFECIKSSLWKRYADRMAVETTLSQYYGLHKQQNEFEWLSRPLSVKAIATIVHSSNHFPYQRVTPLTSLPTIIDKNTRTTHDAYPSPFVFVNGPSAPFADVWRWFDWGETKASLMVMLQCKWLCGKSKLSMKDVKVEIAKNRGGFEALQPTWWRSLGSSDDQKRFGDFFSPTLADRSFYLATIKLNVNVATYDELKRVPGLGDGKVRDIMNAKAARESKSWATEQEFQEDTGLSDLMISRLSCGGP